MLDNCSDKEKKGWFILFISATVLLTMLVVAMFKDGVNLNEVFIFFGSISAMILGSGIYQKIIPK